MLETQLEQDLKAALLAGDRLKVDTLRGLKSALQYAKVDKGKRETGLSKEEEMSVLAGEAKKRRESAELYEKGGSRERAQAELAEEALIKNYLPKQLSEEGLQRIVEQTIAKLGVSDESGMGRVIGEVKSQTAGAADGGQIAKLTKELLSK